MCTPQRSYTPRLIATTIHPAPSRDYKPDLENAFMTTGENDDRPPTPLPPQPKVLDHPPASPPPFSAPPHHTLEPIPEEPMDLMDSFLECDCGHSCRDDLPTQAVEQGDQDRPDGWLTDTFFNNTFFKRCKISRAPPAEQNSVPVPR